MVTKPFGQCAAFHELLGRDEVLLDDRLREDDLASRDLAALASACHSSVAQATAAATVRIPAIPYLISIPPGARTNRAPQDDIDRVPDLHERVRWILKQARQSAARKNLEHPTVGRAFILGAASPGRATAIADQG